jgi:hypothetical protein
MQLVLTVMAVDEYYLWWSLFSLDMWYCDFQVQLLLQEGH